jgi:hypothetical protein
MRTKCALYFTQGLRSRMLRKEWRKDAPDLSVKSLTEREGPITAHFSKPQVQCIGSTSDCGCDFPHAMFQNGEWPWFEDENEDELDRQSKATEQHNRESLVTLLRQTGESSVELYGVWDGDFDFRTPPAVPEKIPMDAILDPAFRFRSRGFTLCAWRHRSVEVNECDRLFAAAIEPGQMPGITDPAIRGRKFPVSRRRAG